VNVIDVDRICVVIGRTRHGMMQEEIKEAATQGARFIELRLDFLKKAPDFKRLLENKPCPLVATVRRPPDGGKWDAGEDARKMLIRQAIVAGFDWVDLEEDIADSIPRFGKTRRIVSYHNFREFPPNLDEIHERMCKQDADVVKLAVRAQHPKDNLRILSLIASAPKPTVAFCVNDVGFPSRLLQAKFGSPFTYAAFNKERFPMLPSFQEVSKLYRYRSIDARTRVFGVIGDPIGHSLSPLIYNSAFAAMNLNAVYLPFRVARDAFESALEVFNQIPVDGYSVTIPHKEKASEVAKDADPPVTRCRAANTLILREEGGFYAYNTDYSGVLATFHELLPTFSAAPKPEPPPPGSSPHLQPLPVPPQPASLSGRLVLILGAGGVARAVAHALQREGANITITNRTPERAVELATEVTGKVADWNARHSVLCDTVINCTPIGMHPNVDESPLHESFLKPGLIVFDTVYSPEQTLLIKEARERKCNVITGVELFIRQAMAQYEYFFDLKAPVDLFRKVVRRALSPINLRDEGEGA
jgi:3-dehydroquinate dehydratase/shikimate dehydrogenase